MVKVKNSKEMIQVKNNKKIMQVKKNKKIKQVKNTKFILNNESEYKLFPLHQLQPKLSEKCYTFLESIFPDNFISCFH